MADDLVKRLRDSTEWYHYDAELKMKCAGRIEELEAKLAKAVEALEFYGEEAHYSGEYFADPCGCCGSWFEPKIHKDGEDSGDMARTTLAELKEESDD